ncbi:RidA family protein [Nocardia cyriacigeorgica]|uniref:Enamine/imine deaminase n=1 Tax=Nocardia cyriacigeorgica TaxID=135487 RepID=A0A4U8W215_9NOCA|nr:RidA family protein [Nocardia cyriacigeorgica]MBF6159837.1 RidA family protein [Nocardia cyriacigeorgica]MBF6198920.1 RidA family protein [Nocardia cyriacigeorgica]MBF6512759.1 RidA family protein [Nocardia cyriacigeorgica]VFA99902.1 Enamine/imine deaminase [Nocardia cyriacigeorgica]
MTTRHIEKIATTPDWYEPYKISQAIKANGMIHVSGQAGIDERGRTVSDDFLTQGRQAFANVGRVLAQAGVGFEDVVKVGIFVTDMAANLDKVIQLRGEFLTEPFPADTLLEVSGLAQPDWQIEVEVTALAR